MRRSEGFGQAIYFAYPLTMAAARRVRLPAANLASWCRTFRTL